MDISQVGSSQGCNTSSQPAPSIALGSQVGASQTSQIAQQRDPDPDPDEYVGVNDEDIYCHSDEVVHEEHIGPDPILLDEEATIDDAVDSERVFAFDPENPKIEVGEIFPNADAFRKSLRHFAIKNEFEVHTVKSDKKRFIGKCKDPSCPWRIHASTLQDNKTFMVKVLPYDHSCPSTTMVDGKMASSSWVSDRVGDWLRKNPSAGAKEVQNKLEDEFHVKVSYDKAWLGRKDALDQIHGSWEESFQSLYNFKGELEKRCPGSIVEIDCKRVDNKMVFSKIFVALKPCIDGFLHGCRPYLGIDSTHLTGKYKGQLAAAAGVDGHNWLYPVAYGVFDLETTENWGWFMAQLKRTIGTPPGLAISSDAGKGLESAIARVFPDSEHRECMRHLMSIYGESMENYVHEYFSIAKFRVAYEGVIRPMTDKSQWITVDPGFKVNPPPMKRPPGRPRKERIPGCLESRARRKKCKRCKQFGHQERTCKGSVSEVPGDAPNSRPSTNKRKSRSSNALAEDASRTLH